MNAVFIDYAPHPERTVKASGKWPLPATFALVVSLATAGWVVVWWLL